MNSKAPTVRTVPQQYAKQLKGVEDILDTVYKDLAARLRQLGFALHPKWTQHELIREDWAARYVTHAISDKHRQCPDRATVWLDFGVESGDEQGVAVCSVLFELERFAPGDDSVSSSIPRVQLQRKRDIVWPDGDASVWEFAADISAKRAELIEEFCLDVVNAISP